MFYCLISHFLDQESIWSADQKTGVYIYRRKRVSVLITLINATQGVVFPRKRVSLGDIFQKYGAWFFGGDILKMCRNNKIKCFLLIFSFSGPRKYLVRGPKNRSIYIQTEKSFCLILQISTLYSVIVFER